MNADPSASGYPDDDAGPLARLLAGGRHNRLLILGDPPAALAIGETGHFERVVRLLPSEQSGPPVPCPMLAIGDPARLPFVEALFDRVLLTSVLPVDTARAQLRELWRIMSPAALGLLVIKARRPWQVGRPGWLTDDLAPILNDAMFEVIDQRIRTLPDRHHLLLVAKRDGLRAAPIGAVQAIGAQATA